jgi:hypothetical protein
MNKQCLELLEKLDECVQDPDFQIILIMKFIRTMQPYITAIAEKGEKDERNTKRISV